MILLVNNLHKVVDCLSRFSQPGVHKVCFRKVQCNCFRSQNLAIFQYPPKMLSHCSNAGRTNAERQGGCEQRNFHLWKVSRLHQIHAPPSYSPMPGSKLDWYCGLVMMSPLWYQDAACTLNNNHQLFSFRYGLEEQSVYGSTLTEWEKCKTNRNLICGQI